MKSKMMVLVLIAFGSALPALAKTDNNRKALIEMHQKMAERHRVAAQCLKSGKSIDECNKLAMQGCPMMNSGHCPFMDNNMMKGGMMGDHDMGMMNNETGK